MSTRLVRVSEELFQTLMSTATSEVTVEWGEPVEWVWPLDDPSPEELPVYNPVFRRHFHDDLDDDGVTDHDVYGPDFGEEWVP